MYTSLETADGTHLRKNAHAVYPAFQKTLCRYAI
jgi:hypothetical protein